MYSDSVVIFATNEWEEYLEYCTSRAQQVAFIERRRKKTGYVQGYIQTVWWYMVKI